MGRMIPAPAPFIYPAAPHVRKHGPFGYRDYESYRDWLRDEFSFRCVFCLNREQWGVVLGNWNIDHFVPQSVLLAGKLLYENLLNVCRRCNGIKSNRLVPDPCRVAFGQCLVVRDDGIIHALNEDGELLMEILRLNHEDLTRFRHLIIGTVRSLFLHDRGIFIEWMRYPQNLPDLGRLKPPGNTKPNGIDDSFYARHSRGELPETY